MKIRILTSVAGPEFAFAAGDEPDLPPETAKALIACGHAEASTGRKRPETTEAADVTERAVRPPTRKGRRG